MRDNHNILDIIQARADIAREISRTAMIIQPGALGDSILTLPLARYLKDNLRLGSVIMLGHLDYIAMFISRTCIDKVRAIESTDLHRLFADYKDFDLEDADPLIYAFDNCSPIISFLGEPDSDFEKNLIYTVNCSHSADVIILPLKPPADYDKHITDFYFEKLTAQCDLPVLSSVEGPEITGNQPANLLTAPQSDITAGRSILKTSGADLTRPIITIAPGSGDLKKCWHLSNFIAIAKELIDNDYQPVFMLGPAELERFSPASLETIRETAPTISGLSITELTQAVSASSAYLGNDSGTSHLAAALGIKTITIFGPTNPDIYRPFGTDVTVIKADIDTFTSAPDKDLQNQILTAIQN